MQKIDKFMEIIFADKYYGTSQEEKNKFEPELKKQLLEFDPDVSTKQTDIGHGADWPVVLVEIFKSYDWDTIFGIVGAGSLFLLGDKLNKGIEGWIEIAKKFNLLISKLKPTRIDKNGALLYVLNEMSSKGIDCSNLDISIQVIDFTPCSHGDGRLGKNPDSLYLIKAKSESKLYLYGLKSNLKMEFNHEFGTEWFEFN